MSRLFVDVQRAAARGGAAPHSALRLRDLVATGQVTQHTMTGPVRVYGELVEQGGGASHTCAYCVSTPLGPLHMDREGGRVR